MAHSLLLELCYSIHIPLPTKPLEPISPDCPPETVAKKLDAFFDDIIQGYPEETRDWLHTMYYDEPCVQPVAKLLEKKSIFAGWIVGMADGPQTNAHRIFIEESLASCPIVKRFLKIHEIGGHAGQAHQRITQVGLMPFLMRELSTKDLNFFAELSAAMPEKMLMDTLPTQIIAADLKKNAKNTKIADLLLENFTWGKKFTYKDYCLLLHRVHVSGEAKEMAIDDYITVHSRPDVRAFDLLMEGKETGERTDYLPHRGKFAPKKSPPK